jgi:hypothetical protein
MYGRTFTASRPVGRMRADRGYLIQGIEEGISEPENVGQHYVMLRLITRGLTILGKHGWVGT